MVLGSGEDDDCRKVVDTDEESDGTDEGSGTSSDDDVADAKRTAMQKSCSSLQPQAFRKAVAVVPVPRAA